MSEADVASCRHALPPVTVVPLHVRPVPQRGDVEGVEGVDGVDGGGAAAGAASGSPASASSSGPIAGPSGSSSAFPSTAAPFAVVPDRASSGSLSSSAGGDDSGVVHATKATAMSATATIRTFTIDYLRSRAAGRAGHVPLVKAWSTRASCSDP